MTVAPSDIYRMVPPGFRAEAIPMVGGMWKLMVQKIGAGVDASAVFQDMVWGMAFEDFKAMIVTPVLLACQRAHEANHGEAPPPEQVRGSTHGDYSQMAMVIQGIKGNMWSGESWTRLNAGQREALELIATKIGRIVTGDPHFRDHWDDIIGYATLARDRIAVPKKD